MLDKAPSGTYFQKTLTANQAFAQAELALKERQAAQAIDLYRIAEARGFDSDACCGARWVCHMLLGDFDSAWKESEQIDKHGRPDVNRFWDRKPLRGQRVLIRCLHGLGDTLQFIRYAPLLRKQVASLTIETQPPLKRLIQQSGLADYVMTWGEPEPVWDRQIEILELPRIFRTTIETIPSTIPYLKGTPREHVGSNEERLRVGLVWASSRYNPSRCIPLATLSEVCRTPGVEFYSFQAGDNRHELADVDCPIQDAFDRSGCIQGAADGLANMHLLITVDTMMAHLGGALGMPVWMLLPFQADWRWMLYRTDSPWYSTMRLFRQEIDGEWDAPVNQLRSALQRLISGSEPALSRVAATASAAFSSSGSGPGSVQ
jgi:hypothetical protein